MKEERFWAKALLNDKFFIVQQDTEVQSLSKCLKAA